MISRTRKTTGPTPTLVNLPVEILDSIIQHLPQSTLYSLLLANSNFIELAASYLYTSPHFASTYRYAQFAYTVSHKPYYAEMVRVLDLSYFAKENLGEQGEVVPMAGWREFKYRHNDEYYGRDRMLMVGRGGVSSHPVPSPYLKSFHRTRDVPIGGLCHVLAACKRTRKINLSRLQLASDFLLSTPSSSPAYQYVPTATSNLLFVSDVPKSWTWASSELSPVYADFVVSHLTMIDSLESLKAKNCLWLTTRRVKTLCGEQGPERLVKVDFRGSGMQKDARWAVQDSRESVRRLASMM